MAVTLQPQYGAPKGMMTGETQMGMAPMTGVPPGLEYLCSVDSLLIKQKIEVMELLTGCETKNKYNVLNMQQQQVYYAYEESECCHRICCGPNRGFIFHIQDNYERDIMRIERPFKCCVGCPWCADGCCAYPIYIYDGAGNKLGMMRMSTFCCAPIFGIFDNNEEQLYRINGDCCRIQAPCCRADVDFPVSSIRDGSQVANVAKQWGGTIREMITDADSYKVSFPMDMHVIHKALIFASTFLVDMILYENKDGGGGN